MTSLLLFLFVSLVACLVLSVPFIDLLYKLKFRNPKHKSEDMFGKKTIFAQLHGHKQGTPTGAGILLIILIISISLFISGLVAEVDSRKILLLISAAAVFGLIGFLDDLQKFFDLKKNGVLGLRIRHKFLLQVVSAVVLGFILHMGFGLDSIGIPGLFTIELGPVYIAYATLYITYFLNAYNIADGLDGLSGGLLLILLLPIWFFLGGLVSAETIIVAVMIGVLIGFLYFNINPARYFMGDTGSLGLGALVATLALLTQTDILVAIAGSVIIFEGLSSLIQWGFIRYRGKGLFKIAPVHHHFEAVGWKETTVVMRFWIVALIFGLIAIHIFTLASA